MNHFRDNITKLVDEINSLHQNQEGFDSEKFLEVRKSGTLQEFLVGKFFCLKSPQNKKGLFITVRLNIRRPLARTLSQTFFYNSISGKVERVDNTVQFINSLEVMENESDELPVTDFVVFNEELSSWVRDEIEQVQTECYQDFCEERDRLSTYYKKQFDELIQKKKSVFFHNYFFEKEARIKEEIKQNQEEMQEQEELLSLRYTPNFGLDVLVCGSLD